MGKTKIAFICIHNSCRSQMAEGFARALCDDTVQIYSAGSQDYPQVKPLAVQVMAERDIDISVQYPKLFADIPTDIDYVISMGCGVTCPTILGAKHRDWGLDDPSGAGIDTFRVTRDKIEILVRELLDSLGALG